MAKYKLLVFSNPVAGREDEYNDWYTHTHLDDVKAVPGFTAAQRFKAKEGETQSPSHQYLAIYDLDVANPAAALGELMSRSTSGAMKISDALDPAVTTLLYEAI